MSDLLKEAIADAKAVRETALQNAKMALEEAFTPHLKSMLSAKLAEDEIEEDEDVYEGEHEEDEEDEEEIEAEGSDRPKGGMYGREDDDDEEDPDDSPREGMHDEDDEKEDKEVDESEIIEIDGVKYAPVVSEEEHEDKDEEVDESEELDLEAVIKELEEELEEAGDPGDEEESVNEVDEDDSETVEEEVVTEDDDEDDDKEKQDEQSTSSGIGKGTGVKQPSAGDEEDPGKGKIHAQKESVDKLQGELKEYKEAVSFLRDKLHEVNILNAKLLYTNKLFKEFVLSNDQKLKIVETFDRAQTTREIKLVYSTLAESYKDNGGERKEVVKESYASKKSGGTAPKTKIITEESQVADRFRKLAGLKS